MSELQRREFVKERDATCGWDNKSQEEYLPPSLVVQGMWERLLEMAPGRTVISEGAMFSLENVVKKTVRQVFKDAGDAAERAMIPEDIMGIFEGIWEI